MARIARIATTVTARYVPASGVKDGFWLDGRLSGRRETRMADITLDREDRGAFYAVFARPAASGDAEADTAAVKRALERMSNDVKHTARNIDTEINELADCAVEVCGRISISQEGVRQPYFAGIIVKDNEVAAVTLGAGCAYLYRGDALYPLTGDDFVLEPVDALGNVVHNLEAYCAGTAGTVRYSNIAPLLPDDCLIVCNREVMETLGQKEVLRLLYEAEDQCDAAGLMVTSAAAKAPGLPIQFLIGFAEAVTNGERGARAVPFRAERGAAAGAAAGAAGAFAAFRGKPAEPPEEIEEAEEDEVEETSYRPESPAPVSSRRTAPPPPRPDNIRREQPTRRGPGLDARKIALALLMIAIAVGSIFAIYTILTGNGPEGTPTPAPTPTSSVTAEPTAETTPGQETPTPTAGELSTPTPGPGSPTTPASKQYTVKTGDTLWGICVSQYGKYTTALGQGVIDANVAKYPKISPDGTLQTGWVLTIPAQ